MLDVPKRTADRVEGNEWGDHELVANLAITALPHRDTGADIREVWRQKRGDLHFEFRSGYFGTGEPIGIPFGPTARLILIHQLTEAIRNDTWEVSLKPSANQWISGMKDGVVGGRTYRQFSNQSLRLGTCTVKVSKSAQGYLSAA
jgi:hypothetical protein